MRRGISLPICGYLLWAATSLLGQQDFVPWHVAKVTKLDRARPVAPHAASEAGPTRYLHVAVNFAPGVEQKLHEFSIVDTDGKSVGSLWGFNRQQSLLIFEREAPWSRLVGLYLQGLGHKEPLFGTEQANHVPRTADMDVGRRPSAEPKRETTSPPLATNMPATSGEICLPDTGPAIVRENSGHTIVDRSGGVVRVSPNPSVMREDPQSIESDDNLRVPGDFGVVPSDAGRSGTGGGRRSATMGNAGAGTQSGGVGSGEDAAIGDSAALGTPSGRRSESDPSDRGGTEAGGSPEASVNSGTGSESETAAKASEDRADGAADSAGNGDASGMQLEAAEGTDGESGAGSDRADGTGLGQAAGDGSGSEGRATAGSGTEAGMGSGAGGGPGASGSAGAGGAGAGGAGDSYRLAYREMPPYLRELYPGLGGGVGRGSGVPGLDGAGSATLDGQRQKAPIDMPKILPPLVLYISCGDEVSPGKIYQVNEHGNVLGIVNLPGTATGLALHRDHGLVCALPRSGQLMRIDETGKVSTLLEKQDELIRPIDVGMAADSDTIVVADNMLDVLMATSTGGNKPCLYRRFEGLKWDRQEMSVAVTTDRHVIFGSDGNAGIYRFAGDEYSASQPPLLPGHGGVAADPASLKWAATQSPNRIHVFEGDQEMQMLTLPANKSVYRQGLLSFAPAGSVVVAVRDSQDLDEAPWLIQYQTAEGKEGQIRSLFPWTMDEMVDFVVGPRMYWNRHSPSTYPSLY